MDLGERERFRQTAQRGLAAALALRAGSEDSERRLRTARAILALDPFDESAHCAVMQAYATQGYAVAGDRPLSAPDAKSAPGTRHSARTGNCRDVPGDRRTIAAAISAATYACSIRVCP